MQQYDQIADKYELSDGSILKRYSNGPTLVRLCGNLSGKEVVDLGCGTGFSTRIVKQQCNPRSSVGIDVSEKEISIARKIEFKNPLEIKYFVSNAKDFDFNKHGLFDVATALFLLNYATSRAELFEMCRNIYSGLKSKGKFITIIPNSSTPTFESEKYEVTVEMKKPIKEGDLRTVTYFLEGNKLCSFDTYFWFKETYERVLYEVGFQSVSMSYPIVSDHGYSKFEKGFWEEYLESPHSLGMVCKKA